MKYFVSSILFVFLGAFVFESIFINANVYVHSDKFQQAESFTTVDSKFVNDKNNDCSRYFYFRSVWHINEFVEYKCKNDLKVFIEFPEYKSN